MATVFVARRRGAAGFGRVVVVKRVHRHLVKDAALRTMLLDEANVASQIRHPNVVSVVDVVETEHDELCLVMEYVESVALSQVLATAKRDGRAVPPAIASRIVIDVLNGLAAAHEATDASGHPLAVIHRDVSPQNVIVGVDGTSRVIDFGIAKAAHRVTQTESGNLRGKLPYLSPEQLEGRPIDRRVDVFAAGIVLHETLTAERLFLGQNDADTLWQVLHKPIPRLGGRTGVPPALDEVLAQALSRDAAGRFATAGDFALALERELPPAPPRDVATWLGEVCRPILDERRSRIAAALAEPPRRAPLSEPTATLPSEPAQPPPRSSWRLVVAAAGAATLTGAIAIASLRGPGERGLVTSSPTAPSSSVTVAPADGAIATDEIAPNDTDASARIDAALTSPSPPHTSPSAARPPSPRSSARRGDPPIFVDNPYKRTN